MYEKVDEFLYNIKLIETINFKAIPFLRSFGYNAVKTENFTDIMIFGKINYLNLLPFHIFIKKYMKHSQQKSMVHYKKGVPSEVNKAFKQRRVDAAFVSSVETKKYQSIDLGIVAKKEVLSVLVIPGEMQDDKASATSNVLARRLGVKGRVLIGDAALKHHLEFHNGVDLAKLWHDKHRLPFVFAKLCYHKKGLYLKKLSRTFLNKEIKIPQYLLKKASLETGIAVKDISYYLSKISYEIDPHAKRSLKKFLKKPRS